MTNLKLISKYYFVNCTLPWTTSAPARRCQPSRKCNLQKGVFTEPIQKTRLLRWIKIACGRKNACACVKLTANQALPSSSPVCCCT